MTYDDVEQQKIGYGIEAAEETDPITTTSSKYWFFGMHTKAHKFDHPVEDHTWDQYYTGNLRNPAETVLQETLVSKTIAYFPVNTVAHYLALGNCVTTTGVHALNNINSGSLPTITVRSERAGGTDSGFHSAVGCKVHTLSANIETLSDGKYLIEAIGYLGIRSQQAALNETHTTGRKYPTDDGLMTGTETKTPFRFDNNASFHWDVNGDGQGDTTYTNDLEQFEYTVDNGVRPVPVENQAEPEFLDEGKMRITFGFTLKRGASDNIFKDYLNKGKDHDMYVHLHAGSTNYQTWSFINCSLEVCRAPYSWRADVPVWMVMGKCEDFATESKDGIDTATFYGE